MNTIRYRGEHPVVVTAGDKRKLRGFYTIAKGVEYAKAGRNRFVLICNNGAWKIHAEYKNGVRVVQPAPTTKE